MILGIEIHPAANIFPMMADERLQELAEDIRQHGQQESCLLYQGKLLDGRNRWRACELLGIEPDVCERDEDASFDPVAFVISANLHRRHLTESQRAIVAAKLKEHLQPEAEKRKEQGRKRGGETAGKGRPKASDSSSANLRESYSTNGKASEQAASLLNVSGRSVDHASTVLKSGSKELIAAVEAGEVSVSKAAQVAKTTPKREQLITATMPVERKEKTVFEQLQALWEKADSAARTRFRLWIDKQS